MKKEEGYFKRKWNQNVIKGYQCEDHLDADDIMV